jgi:hypothetical protein
MAFVTVSIEMFVHWQAVRDRRILTVTLPFPTMSQTGFADRLCSSLSFVYGSSPSKEDR